MSILFSNTNLQNGKYKIVSVLGQGGFGITYEAEQTSLGRKVAIKEFFMKEHCNRDETTSQVSVGSEGSRELVEKFRQKFIREAKMIASLDHEHIVKVIDVFEENGTAYYVMEYLEGGSLNDNMKAGKPMPEVEALDCILQVASALSYLHKKGIIHFDVKPSNILKTSEGRLKLVDFGISKHYDEAGAQTSSTPVGISKGYAPLEQYQQGSDIKSFTPATDIYSLGATLYALVSGINPPEASAVNEDGLPVMEGVSTTVMSAIEKAMQPRRKDRPQSVEEFIELLDTHHNQDDEEDTIIVEGTKTPPSTVVGKSTDISSLNSFPKWLLGVLVGVAVAILVLVFTRNEKPASTTSQTSGINNGHEWVDLGLSVKWATCNVGASCPEEYGSYFAWGEIVPRKNNTLRPYKFLTSAAEILRNEKFSKYVTNSKNGPIDNKICLDISDDAARANWGDNWRMPTVEEYNELVLNCTSEWTTLNGVKGVKFTSKKSGFSNNWIFLPAACDLSHDDDYGFYWSSSLDNHCDACAQMLTFGYDQHIGTRACARESSSSIRPITE